MQLIDFNKYCNNSYTVLNLKYTDALTGYDGRSLYNQCYDQQTEGNRILITRYLVAVD